MDLTLLQSALTKFQDGLEDAIKTKTYDTEVYENGQKAKEAAIRGQGLIGYVHEAVKESFDLELLKGEQEYRLYPALKKKNELTITGFLKAKKQDVVILFGGSRPQPEPIAGGPLDGEMDSVGKAASQKAIVIGVRSQMSSVDKNFDTLMERTFAETLNLRLRLPDLVMGEVYLLPVYEYDPRAMLVQEVRFMPQHVKVEKFIRTFFGITDRRADAAIDEDLYKYERSALVLADFRQHPPRLYLTRQELQQDGLVSDKLQREITSLSPEGFTTDLIAIHQRRHLDPAELTTDIEPDSVHPLADDRA